MKFALAAKAGVAFVLLLVLTACVGGVEDTGDDGYIGGSKKIDTIPVGERQKAPVLSGVGLDGEKISTADFAGQTIVVNLWGSWCPPCRKEAPVLKIAAEETADQDVQFLGILAKDDPASAKAFNTKVGITYPSIHDADGRNQAAFADTLGALGIPTTWIIDEKGRLAARITDSELSAATLIDIIEWTKADSPA